MQWGSFWPFLFLGRLFCVHVLAMLGTIHHSRAWKCSGLVQAFPYISWCVCETLLYMLIPCNCFHICGILIMGPAETLCTIAECVLSSSSSSCVGKHVLRAILAVRDMYCWAHLESVWGGTLTWQGTLWSSKSQCGEALSHGRVHCGAVNIHCQ